MWTTDLVCLLCCTLWLAAALPQDPHESPHKVMKSNYDEPVAGMGNSGPGAVEQQQLTL